MKQLGAFLRLQFTMPKADTYSSVVLQSDGAKFVTTGTFDLTAATPAITATETSSTFTINLTNVSTSAANEVLTVYALIAPVDLSAANIKVTVHGAGLTTYVQTVSGKNFQAGKAYNIAIETFPSGTNASGEDVSWEETHEYVDLGLSVKWATMNVGATEVAGTKKNSHTGKLDCYGEYYAWGETTPKDSYDWANLKYRTSGTSYSDVKFSKYVASSYYGTVDNKTTLELSDDAARTNWGGTWHMPTDPEQRELLNNCYWEYTTSYNGSGVTGYIVYKVKDASDKGKHPYYDNGFVTPTPIASYSLSDTHIFLPASGYRDNSSFYNVGSDGFYWSSSLISQSSYNAWYLGFDSNNVGQYASYRQYGLSVRPVCP